MTEENIGRKKRVKEKRVMLKDLLEIRVVRWKKE